MGIAVSLYLSLARQSAISVLDTVIIADSRRLAHSVYPRWSKSKRKSRESPKNGTVCEQQICGIVRDQDKRWCEFLQPNSSALGFFGVNCYPDACGVRCPFHAGNSSICGLGTTDRCLLWQNGMFIFPSGRDEPTSQRDPTSQREPTSKPHSCKGSSDSDGTFVGGVWVPKVCRLGIFSSFDALAALDRKKIVFAGDSMIRQLFMRFVAHLRGFDSFVEAFVFHRNAVYLRNATHDVLCTTEYLDCDGVIGFVRPSLTAHFVWSPDTISYDLVTQVQRRRKDVIVVLGLLYHLGNHSMDQKKLKMVHRLSEAAMQLFWIATPETTAFNASYSERNAKMRRWASQSTKVQVLAFDKLRAAGPYREANGPHFQCKPDLSKPPEQQAPCADLRDTLNWSLIQLILNNL